MSTPEPLPLIDHHVHGVVTADLDRAGFELLISEASGPPAAGTTAFDSQLGFAIRRWCAPVLDLEPLEPAENYLRRRAELGAGEVNRRLLTAAGVAQSPPGAYLTSTRDASRGCRRWHGPERAGSPVAPVASHPETRSRFRFAP